MGGYKKSETTKAKIVSAASQLFYDLGYRATSIKKICDMSGLSVSRVNYHFTSKADLAGVICGKFLDDVYDQVKSALKNEASYSILSEVIEIKFFVSLYFSTTSNTPHKLFFDELARDGILEDILFSIAKKRFENAASSKYLQENSSVADRIDYYARIYAASLPALMKMKSGEEDDSQKKEDIYAQLYMQLLDIPKENANAILESAREYCKKIRFDIDGFKKVCVYLDE